jgi:hypothetical protein
MKSDPQLREDVRRLQARVLQLGAELQQAKSAVRVVERIVEKPVREVIEIVVEKPVTVVTERIVEKPIKVRVVEFQDNPQTLKELEAARKAIVELQARPPEIVVKTVTVTETVEKPVEKIVERVVEHETIKTAIENRPDPAVSRALAKALKEVEKLRSRPPQTITVERLITVGHDELLAKVHKLQAELAEYKQEGS